jgi:hypothetical protein
VKCGERERNSIAPLHIGARCCSTFFHLGSAFSGCRR